MKRDGHTHTEFCPHGSGEDVEEFILRAIKLGFTEYSITEHSPLPKAFMKQAAGVQEAIDTAGMKLSDVPYYLKKMHHLKKKYESDIKIDVGFEVDYLVDFEEWTTDFLNEFGNQLDDTILSLHFVKGTDGYRALDYSPDDYHQGVVQFYGSFQQAQEHYFRTLLQLVQADLGVYKPKRIGHMTLCQKFQNYFKEEDTSLSKTSLRIIDQLLDHIKRTNGELDFNLAGMFKPYCGEPYPPLSIMQKVKEKGISFVYGSDSHSVDDVGRGYLNMQNIMNN